MPRVSKLQLPFAEWPEEDRRRWEEAFRPGDLFDEEKRGTDLSEATRNAQGASYAEYLRFIAEHHAALLIKLPEARLDRQLVAEYVGLLRGPIGTQASSPSCIIFALRCA